MYEGVTEYFANLFQVKEGLISEDEFFNKMMEKVAASKNLNDAMSFTIMSENVLKAPYKDQYLNVYQKGALIGMCIDIMLREESNGQRGILSLMKELSNKYGKNKPFEDDKLIDEIVAMTYPSLREFFDSHVIGDIPINYNQYFNKVGLEIGEGQVETGYVQNAGVLLFGADPQKGQVFFSDAVTDNSFWKAQGVQPNDVLKAVDGELFTMANANNLLQKMFMWKPGTDIQVTLERDGKDIEIKTKTTKSYTTGNGIFVKDDVTDAQKTLREAWLKG